PRTSSMPRAFTAAARSSRECGPRAWSVGSPPPTRNRSPPSAPPSCGPVALTSVTSVSVWGSSDSTPMAVRSFSLEAGVSGTLPWRLISPSPSTHTDKPTVVPSRRGSARWASMTAARAAAAGGTGGSGASTAVPVPAAAARPGAGGAEAAPGAAGPAAVRSGAGAPAGVAAEAMAAAAGPDGPRPAGATTRCWAVPPSAPAMWECSTSGRGGRSGRPRKPSGPGAKLVPRTGASRAATTTAGRRRRGGGVGAAHILRPDCGRARPPSGGYPTNRLLAAQRRLMTPGWARWGRRLVGAAAALGVVVVGRGRRRRRLHRWAALAPHGGRGVGAGGQVGGLVDEGHHDAHGVGDRLGGVVDRLQIEHLALLHRTDPVPGADAHGFDRPLVGRVPAPAGPAGAQVLPGRPVRQRGADPAVVDVPAGGDDPSGQRRRPRPVGGRRAGGDGVLRRPAVVHVEPHRRERQHAAGGRRRPPHPEPEVDGLGRLRVVHDVEDPAPVPAVDVVAEAGREQARGPLVAGGEEPLAELPRERLIGPAGGIGPAGREQDGVVQHHAGVEVGRRAVGVDEVGLELQQEAVAARLGQAGDGDVGAVDVAAGAGGWNDERPVAEIGPRALRRIRRCRLRRRGAGRRPVVVIAADRVAPAVGAGRPPVVVAGAGGRVDVPGRRGARRGGARRVGVEAVVIMGAATGPTGGGIGALRMVVVAGGPAAPAGAGRAEVGVSVRTARRHRRRGTGPAVAGGRV